MKHGETKPQQNSASAAKQLAEKVHWSSLLSEAKNPSWFKTKG